MKRLSSILLLLIPSFLHAEEASTEPLFEDAHQVLARTLEKYRELETYSCSGSVHTFALAPPPPIHFQLALDGKDDLRIEWLRQPSEPTLQTTRRSLRKEGDYYALQSSLHPETRHYASRNQAIMISDPSSKGIFSILFDFLDERRNSRVSSREASLQTVESLDGEQAYQISLKGYDVNLIWINARTFEIVRLETRRKFKTALANQPQTHSIVYYLEDQSFNEEIDPEVFVDPLQSHN